MNTDDKTAGAYIPVTLTDAQILGSPDHRQHTERVKNVQDVASDRLGADLRFVRVETNNGRLMAMLVAAEALPTPTRVAAQAVVDLVRGAGDERWTRNQVDFMLTLESAFGAGSLIVTNRAVFEDVMRDALKLGLHIEEDLHLSGLAPSYADPNVTTAAQHRSIRDLWDATH